MFAWKPTATLRRRCIDNKARQRPSSHNNKVRMHVLENLESISLQKHRSDAPAPGIDSYTDPAAQAASDPSTAIEARQTPLICATRTKTMAKPAAKKRADAKAVKQMERLESQGCKLTPTNSTTIRPLAARSNT